MATAEHNEIELCGYAHGQHGRPTSESADERATRDPPSPPRMKLTRPVALAFPQVFPESGRHPMNVTFYLEERSVGRVRRAHSWL